MHLTGSAIIQFVGTLLSAGLLTKVIQAVQNRRKMPTTAITVLQQAASTAVERTDADNARLRVENEAIRIKERATDQLNAILLDALQDQVAYSKRQTVVIRQLGGVIEDPPPLPPELVNH
jgi:xanthine dehydrogenase molybdopterin-binding subunit B